MDQHPDYTNLNFLCKRLRPSNFVQEGRINAWYRRYIKPDLSYNDRNGNSAFRYFDQIGGDKQFVVEDGKMYTINVDIIRPTEKDQLSSDITDNGKLDDIISSDEEEVDKVSVTTSDNSDDIFEIEIGRDPTSDLGNVDGIIYFFSITGTKDSACSIVELYPTAQTATIKEINKINDCFTPIGVKKKGRVVLLATINYLKTNKVELGIDRIILQDSSFFECVKEGFVLSLDKSRQLCGRFPFYYDFGFTAILDSSRTKVEENLAKIVGLKVMDRLGLLVTLEEETKDGSYQEILEFVKSNQHMFITDLCSYLVTNHCEEFSHLYEYWFDLLKLKRFNFQETYYEMVL